MTQDIMSVLEEKSQQRKKLKDTWGKTYIEVVRKLKEEQKGHVDHMTMSRSTVIFTAKHDGESEGHANTQLSWIRKDTQASYDLSVRLAKKRLIELWDSLNLSGSAPKIDKKLSDWKIPIKWITEKEVEKSDEVKLKEFYNASRKLLDKFLDGEQDRIASNAADIIQWRARRAKERQKKSWLNKILKKNEKEFAQMMKFFIEKYLKEVKELREKMGLKKKVPYKIPYWDVDRVSNRSGKI